MPTGIGGFGGFGGVGTSLPNMGAMGGAGSNGLFGLGDYGTGALISGGIGLLGGIMQGAGQGKLTEAQLAQARELALRDEALRREQLQQQQGQLGLQATQQDPLAMQRSRQQQALMAAILPELRNVSISSNIPGMNRFIPQISGGLRLPEGGFSKETLGYFSPDSRAAAEGQYWRQAAPFVPPPDLSKVGYGQAGMGMTQPAQAAYDQTQADAKKRNEALMAALNAQATGQTSSQGQKKSTGSKVAGAASGALTGAKLGSMIAPGIGTGIGALAGGLWGLFS